MQKEALFYSKYGDGSVKCYLCPQYCHLKEGQVGFCRVRKLVNGQLVSLNYGTVSSMANDPIEKKPLYDYYPGTMILSLGSFGCNLHCQHCQNADISQTLGKGQKLSVNDLIFLIREKKIEQVAFTYNEPLVWYEYVLEAAEVLRKSGVRIVMVSNGYVNPEPLQKLLPFTDAWSLDIKWFFPESSKRLSMVAHPEIVRNTAKAIVSAGQHLEIVTNIVPGHNDSWEELTKIAEFIVKELGPDISWHLSRAFPRHKLDQFEPTSLAVLEKAREIGYKVGLRKIYLGNI